MAPLIQFFDSTLAHHICHLFLVHWLNFLTILALESTHLELIATFITVLALDIKLRIVGKWVSMWVNVGTSRTIVKFLFGVLFFKQGIRLQKEKKAVIGNGTSYEFDVNLFSA